MNHAVSPVFAPPSPGAWELERTHITKPQSLYLVDTFPEPMMRGFRDGTRAYGALLDYLDVAAVNRFVYTAPRPVGAPKRARGAPPRPVFELLRRVHPEIRRRIRRAEEVFRTRYWREDVARWDREIKPALQQQARALADEDLSAASDRALADHVRRATEFLQTAFYTHHRLNICTMLPVGDFLVHTMRWTGLSAGELLQTMRGLSPVSAGAVAELHELRRAIAASAEAQALIASSQPAAEIVSALLARTDAVGAAARAYLDVVGLRVIGGYDVADRHAREHPELLLNIIRASLAGHEASRQAAAEEAVARVRARVPAAHQSEFDQLLEEARHTYRVRDERVFHGDALATGLARRAILAAGDRLKAHGRAEHSEDLLDATSSEIVALLEGRPGPSAAELAERARWRRETPLSAAPANLGFPPSPPLPAEWLPPAAARLQRIVSLVLSLMFDVSTSQPEARRLKGFPVSAGVYEGPVRVIQDVDQLATVQRGEVLVATSTGPTFNVVLPLIGAIVTERGGVLSHAAIVSREYGLPGIVGCQGAASTLKTGMRVKVDGTTGEVWILN
jgi:pyruvate,water dikinase